MHRMPASHFQDTSQDPRRGGSPGPTPERRPAREPVFNAPGAAIALVAVIIGGYAVQSRFPLDAVVDRFGFAPRDLTEGRWQTLATALFVHGNWAHALMNGAFALAFATPVARFFGERARGTTVFFLFYMVCGVLSSLGFAAVHPGGVEPLVGASGGVSGLIGAASRLMAGRGRVGPILSQPVLGLGGAWLVMNGIIAVVGGQFLPGAGNGGVAWEAHVAGFLAGLLLIGPFAPLAERR
jgi:membrane associated rhomboid family serine protease